MGTYATHKYLNKHLLIICVYLRLSVDYCFSYLMLQLFRLSLSST